MRTGGNARSKTRATTAPDTGFTLIELLLSITILSVVMLITMSLLNASLGQLRISEARFGQFREVQAAFDTMRLRLAGCEINPFYDYEYKNEDMNSVPIGYKLKSDLHFVTGPVMAGEFPLLISGNHNGHGIFFHGTFGMTNETDWKGLGTLMNSWGYYLEFGDDTSARADFLNSENVPKRYRYRLKELQVPAELMRTYAAKLNAGSSREDIFAWFRDSLQAPENVHTVAENIAAFVVTPLVPADSRNSNGALIGENGLAPTYYYDTRNYQHARTNVAEVTRHRLPPLLRLTLVALDEVSATKLEELNGQNKPDLGVDSLFADATRYNEDIQSLEARLQQMKLNYRVFSTTVRLRNARWINTY
ncbi:uncharacterized protein (TIGR02599 family) [Roseimicrobium gellanilyticum]|uniref:Uncharacterized protein (TIGR02599 family) n=1 Tax=Roseimicrobium gellanilyticum TaxID=748857 RepID=A0A366HQ53_9BACT|nr:Verru_Chthon cassette protein C [Roseimicrobium gellanilyticum]RBP45063.1 uncharacterized protein (TIGR02599 family) [Roseimicrobium gellanilyticum]